ncbi:MAG: site-specific integrase [Hyphomicrobiales bacterium]|nr:site-specific integrase [Hyphomicrobiales bacterium]
MSIRKRAWLSAKGEQKTAWVYDFFDQTGKRRHKTFKLQKDALKYEARTRIAVNDGSFVAEGDSVTVKEAGDKWLQAARADNLERTTLDQYKQHLDLHIEPFLGRIKLSKLTPASVTSFRAQLTDAGRSPAMVRGVVGSLGAILANALELSLVGRNVVREVGRKRRRNGKRHKKKLEVGVDIPTPDEIADLLQTAKTRGGRWWPLLLTAVVTGLRLSELRGLRWSDVDLKKGELHVRQRADRYQQIGSPKSATSQRTIPLIPRAIAALREWKVECPQVKDKDGKNGRHVLVFPNGKGHIERGENILRRGLHPTMIAAKVTAPVLDDKGEPKRDEDGNVIVKAKYTGMHALRHFFASWCINRKAHGGRELPLKVVQELLGHASITMTADRYGHLFPRGDETDELAEAERALLR